MEKSTQENLIQEVAEKANTLKMEEAKELFDGVRGLSDEEAGNVAGGDGRCIGPEVRVYKPMATGDWNNGI